MNLRPYQADALERIQEALKNGRSTLAVLATGLGKTVLFSHVAKRWDGRCLVLAHREELIQQAAEKLHAVTGEEPSIEMADQRADDQPMYGNAKCVVASVQTLSRESRRRRFAPDTFGLVIVDEAHHAVASSYRGILNHFDAAKVLGVTATPRRSDELAMGQVFESVAFDYGIEAAVSDGWLVPIRQQMVKVEDLDFSRVRSTAGDLNEGDLERILTEEKALHAVAAPTVELSGDLPTLVFCVSVDHARLMEELLNRYKPGSAKHLSGKSPREERREWVERFKSGRLQYLCNCGLFLEGFDAPSTACVVMARPTSSLALYVQVLGRGTRPLPGIVDGIDTPTGRLEAIASSRKPNMLVLDFVGNAGRHRIVTAQDVLGGRWGEPVREYARKTAESEGRAADVAEAFERAEAELALLAEERERQRREAIRAKASYHTATVSPFGPGVAPATTSADVQRSDGPTPGQVWFLTRQVGWTREAALRLTKRQASAVIGKFKAGERVAA